MVACVNGSVAPKALRHNSKSQLHFLDTKYWAPSENISTLRRMYRALCRALELYFEIHHISVLCTIVFGQGFSLWRRL